ncbi:Uma2 family endonuclease [Streptomyces sp. NPDC054863]
MAVIQHETHVADEPHGATVGEVADQISRVLTGHRVEIIQGRITVTPPPDGEHALTLTWVIEEYGRKVREQGLRSVQGVGLWLPSGPQDYAVPDLSIVDADFRDAHVEKNCFAPHVFRLVLEVTSSNWADGLGPKVECYAQAGIPVYLVVDRRHDEVLLHTDPREGVYQTRTSYKRGLSVQVLKSLGIDMELSVDQLLDGDPDA